MHYVRMFIVLFFLAVVPAAAAVDAVAPQFLDAALGRKPRTRGKHSPEWTEEAPLVLRREEQAAATPNQAPATAAREIAPPTPPEKLPGENGSAARDPFAVALPNSQPPARPRAEPVFRAAVAPAAENSAAFSTAAPPATVRGTVDSQLLAIQSHLGELGATYMRLETTGSGSRMMYRFLCQMQLSPEKAEVVPFEATAADPLEAMRHVLTDVEAWQATEITRLRR